MTGPLGIFDWQAAPGVRSGQVCRFATSEEAMKKLAFFDRRFPDSRRELFVSSFPNGYLLPASEDYDIGSEVLLWHFEDRLSCQQVKELIDDFGRGDFIDPTFVRHWDKLWSSLVDGDPVLKKISSTGVLIHFHEKEHVCRDTRKKAYRIIRNCSEGDVNSTLDPSLGIAPDGLEFFFEWSRELLVSRTH